MAKHSEFWLDKHPETIREVEIDGRNLTFNQVVAVARHGAEVRLSESARRRVACCRVMVDLLIEQNAVVYGLTTGFGKLRDVPIPPKQAARLQLNLLRSHACGVGRPLPEDVARAAVLLRANTLAGGHSGVRPCVIDNLLHLLNDRLYPYIPSQGSVGSSGDLAPLSHLALVLIGDPAGKIYDPEKARPARGFVETSNEEDFVHLPSDIEELERLREAHGWRWNRLDLGPKEGLALNNGTQIMTALGALALADTCHLVQAAELAGAMSLESRLGVMSALAPEIHRVRPVPHQADVAARLRVYTQDSEILGLILNSAYLNRAIQRLSDCADELGMLMRDREVTGEEATALPRRVRRRITEEHIPQLRALLEQAKEKYLDVQPSDTTRHGTAGAKARGQIVLFNRLMAPIRRGITLSYHEMQRTTFPPAEKARAFMADTLKDLEAAVPAVPPVQDDYSFRCLPQVLACTHHAVEQVARVLQAEINSATDNPLLFPPQPPDGWESMEAETYGAWLREEPERMLACLDGVQCGGNFHGEPVAQMMDYLAVSVAEVGNIAERRIAHLVDKNMSNGLPGFLIESTGLNSGFMIPQYTAAALVSENKGLCHPASVDSIPTSANTEDHNSMGTIAARKCVKVIENVRTVVAIEIFAAFQALSFRQPFLPGSRIQAMVAALEEHGLRRLEDDRFLQDDILLCRRLLREGKLVDLLLFPGSEIAG